MGFFHKLRLSFSPPKLSDPDFGTLLFIYISNATGRSYWEGEWEFPPTRTPISIGLPGDESGPKEAGRRFYLGLPARFEWIITAVRPKLADVWATWLDADLPANIFGSLTLGGFGIEDPEARPLCWDISFETTGEKWLGITVPFIDDVPQDAVVDT